MHDERVDINIASYLGIITSYFGDFTSFMPSIYQLQVERPDYHIRWGISTTGA
jgi:hypothetical protein